MWIFSNPSLHFFGTSDILSRMKNIGVEVAPEHAFGRQFLEGVAAYAATKNEWRLSSVPHNRTTKALLSQLDGLILRLMGSSGNQVEKTAHEISLPVVDIYSERPRAGVAQIHGDYEALGRIAADFFTSRGFVHFGWCGIDGLVFSDETHRHYLQSLETAGQTLHSYQCPKNLAEKIVYTVPDRIPDARPLRKWLRSIPKPVAIFCCNDHRAYQVMNIALDAGFDIPHDIAILGVDNDTMICAYSRIPLSSIDPDAAKIGFSAARILHALIEKRAVSRLHRPVLVSPKGIVERKSTAHIPIDPPWLSSALMEIEKRLSDGIAPSDIFRLSGLSAASVERVFRQKLGTSIIGYITAKRMKRAKHLLETTDLLTKEVAAACGFSSPQYFCRVFQSVCGSCPQSLRQRR